MTSWVMKIDIMPKVLGHWYKALKRMLQHHNMCAPMCSCLQWWWQMPLFSPMGRNKTETDNKFSRSGLFRHCTYPTRGTGKGDSTREFPLDLYREHFQFAIFGQIQHHFSCNLLIKRANMWAFYLEKMVWFHEDLKVLDNFHKIYIDFQ